MNDKEQAKLLVKTLYKNDYGNPFEMTDGQTDIFLAIAKKLHPRTFITTPTQYGKTEVVSMAVLTRAATFPEKWAIVAPDIKRARILIGDIIKHIFENPFVKARFKVDPGESEERIKRERSKNRLTFNTGDGIGEIFVVSSQARFKGEDAGNALMGFGAENVIAEESSLIPDEIFFKVLRMLGGHKDNFLVEIGNPLKRNHFYNSFCDDSYYKIVIDYKQAIKEGRIPREFIEEMKRKMPEVLFDIFYGCKFPPEEGLLNWKQEYERFADVDLKEFQLFSIGTDFAISEKEEADFSAIDVAGLGKDGKMYNILSEKGKWTPDETFKRIASTYDFYQRFAPTICGIEDVGYQRVARDELMRRFGISTYLVKRTTDKRARVLMIQPYFQNSQVFFSKKDEDLIYQLRNFGNIDKDDLVDAFEMAVSLIKNYFILEAKEDKKQKTYKERLIAKAYKTREEGDYDIDY